MSKVVSPDQLDDDPENEVDDTDEQPKTVPMKRFSNLSRKLDQVQKRADRLQQQLDDRDDTEEETRNKHEAEVITLRADAKKLPTLQQQIDTLTKTNSTLMRAQTVRQSLSANPTGTPEDDLADVIAFFDAGHFNPGDAEGDALRAEAKKFKNMLGARFHKDVQETLTGVKPVVTPVGSGANVSGMTSDELQSWLYKNPNHPDYAQYEEAYFASLAAK